MSKLNKVIKLKETGSNELKKAFIKESEKRKLHEIQWPRQISYDEIKDRMFSCFANYSFNEQPTLSEVIKFLDWGSNRVIKQGGFRVLPLTQELKHIKQWDRITDPYFLIKESSYVSKPKGQSIVVVHIEG